MSREAGVGKRVWRGGARLWPVALAIAMLAATAMLAEGAHASPAPSPPPPPNALPVIGGCVPPGNYRTAKVFNISGRPVRVEISVSITRESGGFKVLANVTLAPASGRGAEVFFTPPLADMAVRTNAGTYIWSSGKFFIQVVLRKELPVSTELAMRVNGSCLEGLAILVRPIHRYVALGSQAVTGELIEALSRAVASVTAAPHTATTAASCKGGGLVVYVLYNTSRGELRVISGHGTILVKEPHRTLVRLCINGTCLTTSITSEDGLVRVEGALANMLKQVVSGGRVVAVAFMRPGAGKALTRLLYSVVAATPNAGKAVNAVVIPSHTRSTRTRWGGVTETVPTKAPPPTTTATTTASVTPRAYSTAATVAPTTPATSTSTAPTASLTPARTTVRQGGWLAAAAAAAIAVGVGVAAYFAIRWRP